MSTIELDKLILGNLADLDATALRLGQIDETVWRAVDRVVERWAKEKQWAGLFDVEGRGLWVTPAAWRTASEDEENPDATFWFELASRDPPTHFDLSDLCGVGGSRYGFRFHQKLLGKVEWKELARKHVSAFQQLGMHLDSKASPFIEVVIDPQKLVSDVEAGDYEEALTPIVKALDRLLAANKSVGPLLFKAGTAAGARTRSKRSGNKKTGRKLR